MTVPYRPEAFEPLTEQPWDVGCIREAVARVVAGAEAAFDSERLWPAQEWDAWRERVPLTNLYVGAAGVIWALDALRRRGFESGLDLAGAALRALELPRSEPESPSLWIGESGILLVAWRVAPSAGLADALHARVRENARHEANEIMWGAPGTMLAARAMLEWTGEERWADAWRESAEELWSRREPDGLWTQELWGERTRWLGPAHGAVGNALALLQGGFAHGDELETSMNAALRRKAVVADGLANWPPIDRPELVSPDGQVRLQWDATGPGVVASAASYLDEDLLLAGAELTWRAGAHSDEKGAGLCHGTAGSGYALLKTFERTGDELWLDRARRFAVHALEQVERLPRYSLFTGGVGAALFAADCIDAHAVFPTVDSFG